MAKVRLTHISNLPGAEGFPGAVVEVDEPRAAAWEADGACVRVEASEPLTPPPPKEDQVDDQVESKPKKSQAKA